MSVITHTTYISFSSLKHIKIQLKNIMCDENLSVICTQGKVKKIKLALLVVVIKNWYL
jgi:hypothetical protein